MSDVKLQTEQAMKRLLEEAQEIPQQNGSGEADQQAAPLREKLLYAIEAMQAGLVERDTEV